MVSGGTRALNHRHRPELGPASVCLLCYGLGSEILQEATRVKTEHCAKASPGTRKVTGPAGISLGYVGPFAP